MDEVKMRGPDVPANTPDHVAAQAARRAPGARQRILLTTPTWQSTMACLQSYGRQGHAVHLLGAAPDNALAQSRHCSGIVPSPPESDGEAWLDNLLRVLRAERFDLLVPISDDVVELLARRRDAVAALTNIALAPVDQLEIGRDKAKVTRFAMERGVPVPDSFFPGDLAEARALARDIDYPCVCKLPFGTGNLGVKVVKNAAELIAFFEERGVEGNWPFVQRFVTGDLYDVTAVCDHGKVAAIFGFRSPIKYHLGGTPPYAYSLRDPVLLDAASRFLEALGWHGCVDLDFLLAEDGRYTLLELNPRLSGTTNFAFKLGVDLPRAYLDVALGQASGDYGSTGYASGVLFRTVVPAEVWWWNMRRASRAPEVALKTLNPRTRTNLYWDDRPLLRAQFRDMARLLARKPVS